MTFLVVLFQRPPPREQAQGEVGLESVTGDGPLAMCALPVEWGD